jgi:hypothetical protein
MKVYCPTCGFGTEYSLTKPKFCSSCGEAFAVLNKVPAKRVFKVNPENPLGTVQEEAEEEEFVPPNLEKLDFDLSGSTFAEIYKIENLLGTSNGKKDGYVREADPTYSKESIEKDFLRDAGSSRPIDAQT